MKSTYRISVFLLGLTSLALTACGPQADPTGQAGGTSQASTSDAAGIPAACLDGATVSAAVGFAVTIQRATIKQSADAVNCTFLADDQVGRPGANVSVLVAPASFAGQALKDITDSAARANTATVAVPVGQQGLAYASPQRTAAATVVGTKLIGVTIDGMGLSSPAAGTKVAIDLIGKVAAKAGG